MSAIERGTQAHRFLDWLADAGPGEEFVYPDEHLVRWLVSLAAAEHKVARGYRPIGNVYFCLRLSHALGEGLTIGPEPEEL